jgi:hypothetical protein
VGEWDIEWGERDRDREWGGGREIEIERGREIVAIRCLNAEAAHLATLQ